MPRKGHGPGDIRIKDAVSQVIERFKQASGKQLFEEVKKIHP